MTGIRGNAILRLLRYERGFHDGDVWGAFFFCGSNLLLAPIVS
uniref:SRNA which regulates plasmid replication n=1 Tax=Rhizobium meliloti TaxID=382 RepID=I2E174_RHIML|nr:sRNA which regulates plasmid replication [Sinorhizobium meliloti]